MSRLRYDVVVVGAGPAGSAAALVAARTGARVLLVERGEYPGSKNVSGAAFYAPHVLESLVGEFWRTAPVERHLTRRVISFTSPSSALAVDFRTATWDGEPPRLEISVPVPRQTEQGCGSSTSGVSSSVLKAAPSVATRRRPVARALVRHARPVHPGWSGLDLSGGPVGR